MDVELSIDDQEGVWKKRRQKLEELMGADPSQRQDDPAQPDKIMNPQLFLAAKKWGVDNFIKTLADHCVEERVSLPVLLGRRSPSNSTLLHAAAESDDNVRALIEFVPEHLIHRENSRGETPLHIAARAGKAGAVELLLPQRAPTHTDGCGNSALHEAVRNCHREVIRHLVSKYPNLLYCQNKESKSPLCIAVETGDLKVLELLLEALNDGEDWRRSESQTILGMSPVHVAIIRKEKDMLIKMWEKKPWLFQLRDAGDGTPLHLAAYMDYLDGVKFLMEKCPTSALEQDSTDGYLPIHVACVMGHIKIINELLQQWPDPKEFLTGLGENILHVSAKYGYIKIVRFILKNPKFNHLINARDFNGNTPLHLAALHSQPSVMLLAQHRRVDCKLVNVNNMTALDVVEQDIKEFNAPLKKKLTSIVLQSIGTPKSGELVICKPTGRSPPKRLKPQQLDVFKDQVNTRMVVAALMASVTFTSGYSVPGGYNGSNPDAGIPILLHKSMYNVFVISTSVVMYSSTMALVILLWTHINDPYLREYAIDTVNGTLLIALAAMLSAFMVGTYVTVTKLAWLSIFTLALGAAALLYILAFFIWMYLPFGRSHLTIYGFTSLNIMMILMMAKEDVKGSGTAGRAATSIQGTGDDNLRPHLEE